MSMTSGGSRRSGRTSRRVGRQRRLGAAPGMVFREGLSPELRPEHPKRGFSDLRASRVSVGGKTGGEGEEEATETRAGAGFPPPPTFLSCHFK